MTKAEIILDSAKFLHAHGMSSFTEEELIVVSWKADKQAFGLIGFPYPDSNKVKSVLMGKRGLIARKKLRKVRKDGRTYYALPEKSS